MRVRFSQNIEEEREQAMQIFEGNTVQADEVQF